ncbi:YcbK family protein [Stella sp.]|uniref:YcbK family protein n=1 Tax=Stella sp. TaxID=2912054 RepID=UPI0035B4EDB1
MDDRTEVEQDGSSVGRRGVLGAFAALAAVTALVPGAWAVSLPLRKPEGLAGFGADDGDWQLPGQKPNPSGQLPGRKPEVTQVATRAPRIGRGARLLNLYNVHTGERVRGPFWQDGRYVPETMRSITRMMRDHRANQVHKIDPKLIELLHAIQMRIGQNKPLEIVSGYRSPSTNEMLREAGYGVAEHSYHMVGKAVDIRVPGYRVSQLSRMAKAMRRGGVGTYGSGNFLHIDTGPVRYW